MAYTFLKNSLLAFGVFFSSIACAQLFSNPVKSLRERREFVYGMDNRRTHIKEHNTFIYGIYLGVGFGGKLRYKAVLSATPFERGKFIDENGLTKKNKLLFVSIGEEFDFFHYKRFSVTSNLQVGIGRNYYRKVDGFSNIIKTGHDLIIPIETGIHVNYDLNSWLKFKTGIGWRFVFPKQSEDLSGYYLKLGASINLKTLRLLVFKRSVSGNE